MTPEFGLQTLTVLIDDETLGPAGTKHEVWMSHRDQVVVLPPGFIAIASTPTCPIAAMRSPLMLHNEDSGGVAIDFGAHGVQAALFGNGRPGLKDRLSKLEFYTVVESRFLYWALGIGTAVVAAKIKGLF